MTPLYLLQFSCCIITAMLALQLALASLQVRWRVRRYEASRWILCAAMLLFAVHYVLQMVHGLRARGEDVGAVFNIIFYTPAVFAITLAVINMESPHRYVRRYVLRGAAAMVLIGLIFVLGVLTSGSFHLGNLLYVMLGFFCVTMVYFIYISRTALLRHRRQMQEESGGDIIPYVRYSRASILLLYCSAAFLPVAILFNALLIIAGPVMLLTLVFFVHSFVSLGYYLSPHTEDDGGGTGAEGDIQDGEDAAAMTDEIEQKLSPQRLEDIGRQLRQWTLSGGYKDSSANIYTLSERLGCRKQELTQYFNQSGHTNFRTWLSELRFREAVRMMRTCPHYSNDAISTECGFSSHTQIYRVFKQQTGLSPNQWRDQETKKQ